MAQPQTVQNFENHARTIPAYHYLGFGILIINFIWSVYKLIRFFSADSVIGLLIAVAFFILFFHARLFALTVQDRVIRLEMRLRLGQLLPPDLQPRVKEFTVGQLVALRFASDEELPTLAAKVIEQKIVDAKAIKQMIRSWRADHLRA